MNSYGVYQRGIDTTFFRPFAGRKNALFAFRWPFLARLRGRAWDATGHESLQVYTISANNITASFIPYGARLVSLLVPDRSGQQQDVVVGFDNPEQYVENVASNNAYLGPIVGRYANRIKNSTFILDGVEYKVPSNEFNDTQTLHGGPVGYDQRNWTVTNHTEDSITFALFDPGFENFPGKVVNLAAYTVSSSWSPDNASFETKLTTRTVSIAQSDRTPIMLANHIYWNLNAFKEPNILNDTFLQLPLSDRYISTDSHLIPTGQIADVKTSFDGALDFTSPKLIGQDIQSTTGLCGDNCTGYDTCFIIDRPTNISDWTSSPKTMVPALNMFSTTTGISMLVSTNQHAVQIYTCSGQNGTLPVKQSQVDHNNQQNTGNTTHPVDTVQKYGCIVIEPEGWIDGVNNPQWGQLQYQIFGPDTPPAVNWATYVFGKV
ncbi:aldose 1-epimerase [Coccidioides posadasii str. Silveira]|uniref:Aldose 1-epimerase n=2 Tax=Coccidioides posadasii TaxID=199306 RepID=E9CZI0_COCPS|nr:aldose 1-epimerase [Coccidioides posadasii str. Silveira]KMM72813.1 aldose 1-epimerase [Coccidioides posadasii RMSCC 3488]